MIVSSEGRKRQIERLIIASAAKGYLMAMRGEPAVFIVEWDEHDRPCIVDPSVAST